MRIKQFLPKLICSAAILATLNACDRPVDELLAGLPTERDVRVDVPETMSSASGLVGVSQSALVGEAADYYTTTYHHARKVNKIGIEVALLLKVITAFPPTSYEPGRAVWGPGGDDGDPNEWRLTLQRGVANRSDVIEWRLEGKHKSAAEDTFQSFAFGHFDPAAGDDGQGWFELSLDTIGQLNQTEESGNIAFRYRKAGEEVEVNVRFTDVIADGETLDVGYAFKKERDGSGYFLFDLSLDIHKDDPDAANNTARENLLIRTRWNTIGLGQVDLLATEGDLEDSSIELTQCWGEFFVSTYEATYLNGRTTQEEGDLSACPFNRRMVPRPGELTSAETVANPFN
jgi:hypothetical protein